MAPPPVWPLARWLWPVAGGVAAACISFVVVPPLPPPPPSSRGIIYCRLREAIQVMMHANKPIAAPWRRHRWTALRSLLLVALLHRLHCLPFLAASSPVWLLAAFLLGVVLVHSEPNLPLAAASEDEDRHLYKKIRHLSSDDDDDGSSATSTDEHLVGADKAAAVPWTADDEHSIRSIGSLELERDARLEKLMSRRTNHRNLIDLDVHIPAAVLTKNPFDHHHHCDDTGSAPSFLLGQHSNPFDFPDMMHMQMRRHESFTAGAAARPSRFRPYFVADVPEGGGGDATASDNSNSSASTTSSSATSCDHHLQAQAQQQAAAVKVDDQAPAAPPPEAAPAAATSPRGTNGMVAAVDVELISDSSDDDMSLPGDDDAAAGSLMSNPPADEDEEDSFEVESITQQVAAAGNPRASAVEMSSLPPPPPSGLRRHATINSKEWVAPTTLASVEENERRERELSEIREHHVLGPVPVVIDDDSTTVTGDGAAGAVVVAAAAAKPPPPAASAAAAPSSAAPPPSAKPSSKPKATSKKAVFGFFRK